MYAKLVLCCKIEYMFLTKKLYKTFAKLSPSSSSTKLAEVSFNFPISSTHRLAARTSSEKA
jgi:hypothetical protein